MDLETFLVAVYCLIDDALRTMLHGARLRQRGPTPRLADSEVLTMEIAGEFLGVETDAGLYRYFRRHHRALFPALHTVHRTTFLRQAANLWAVKRALWQQLLPHLRGDPALSIVDSVPVPICRFARAKQCRLYPGLASYGRDPCLPGTFFGLRAHLRVTWPGIIAGLELAPANRADVALAPELLTDTQGWALGDRAYWSPALRERLQAQGLQLLAPFQTRRYEKRPWPRWLVHTRRRIEVVLAQLVERYRAKRTWARDLWHLVSRWLRKVLSHTTAVFLCQHHGLSSLAFSQLVAS